IMLNHFVQLNYNVAEQHHKWLLLSNLGIIIINIVCYFMVIRLSKANSAKVEYELQMIDLNYKKQYAENIKSQQEEIRRIRHDMKQSYQVIQRFVVENNFDELAEYLPQICEQINKISSAVDTNHSIINAILNTKLSFAKSQGIKTLCSSVKQIHAEKIEEIDLCHLIGNMMDNAIEATLKISSEKTKYVEVSITERNAMILITVRNSYEDVLIDEGLNTSKDNKANHGFGIKTIRKIARKYQGSADFYIEGDLFCCSVMLQNI
ncbi:MAG: ATP-binding protein, partial [Turicibacter sp.]|nr:ATP-binding protein [Turicibacter sp.]